MMALYHGDSLRVLDSLAAASIDAMITDPPAGIAFMGEAWDDYRRACNGNDTGRPNVFGRTSARGPEYGRGDRHVFIERLGTILSKTLRVLKPGAHALVWAIPRTSHWTATALEDAGFEIRDRISHLFGQGMPKSRNLRGEHDGWGTGLKPAIEDWYLVRKPLARSSVEKQMRETGTGALNIAASRVGNSKRVPGFLSRTAGSSLSGSRDGSLRRETGGESGHNPNIGRWPANVILSHDESCTDDACDVLCPVRLIDLQSGHLKSGKMKAGTPRPRKKNCYGQVSGPACVVDIKGDEGGASRFFHRFVYAGKVPPAERRLPNGKNDHPTVKSQQLMRHLVTLVTPPGGVVLDPFAGSGSTLLAARDLGFGFVGIEQEERYVEIIEKRLGIARQS